MIRPPRHAMHLKTGKHICTIWFKLSPEEINTHTFREPSAVRRSARYTQHIWSGAKASVRFARECVSIPRRRWRLPKTCHSAGREHLQRERHTLVESSPVSPFRVDVAVTEPSQRSKGCHRWTEPNVAAVISAWQDAPISTAGESWELGELWASRRADLQVLNERHQR